MSDNQESLALEGAPTPISGSSIVLSNEAWTYTKFFEQLPSREDTNIYYDRVLHEAKLKKDPRFLKKIRRKLCLTDRFYLLTRELNRPDADNDFIYEKCRMVESDPDTKMDLWPREHYKSTVITFAGAIQEIIRNPEITICIYSYKRPIAKKFLKQIMLELENNKDFIELWDEIFWAKPKSQSPSWSLDGGLCVKRKSVSNKEQTVEAWGMVDSQPTGAHFILRIYDDVVTRDTVETEGMLEKTNDAYQDSQNTGTRGGRQWVVGTIWHYAETYHWIAEQGRIKPRMFSCTKEGTWPGTPVFMTEEELSNRLIDQGPRVFGAQMLMDISQMANKSLQADWLHYYQRLNWREMNRYMIADPAKGKDKKKSEDFTTIVVIGLGADNNFYVIDWVRDKLSLTERFSMLQHFHSTYTPRETYYEEIGMQSDTQHFEFQMKQTGYRFYIAPLGGKKKKEARIEGLVPSLSAHRWWFPEHSYKTNYEGKRIDVTNEFVNKEYLAYPHGAHDDMLDVLARIFDIPTLVWPKFRANASLLQFANQLTADEKASRWNVLEEESSWDVWGR